MIGNVFGLRYISLLVYKIQSAGLVWNFCLSTSYSLHLPVSLTNYVSCVILSYLKLLSNLPETEGDSYFSWAPE